jgi:outer membrane autotransporter protein
VRTATDSFAENGGVAALSVNSASENVGYSSFGLRAAALMWLADGMALIPRASFAWQHAFGDVNPTVGVAFQSTGAAFNTAGVPIARDAALVDAGLHLRLNAYTKFGIAYQGQLSTSTQIHALTGRFTLNF